MSDFITYIRVCNATSRRIKKMKIDGQREDDWPDKTHGPKQLNGQQIQPWSELSYQMTLSSTRVHEAKFKLHVEFDNGDKIVLSINQYDAYGDDTAKKQTSLDEDDANKLEYGVMQRNGLWDEQSQTQYIIVARYRNDCWMNQIWDKIETRPLWQICMLGTHDAGMSKLSHPTKGATVENTLTQSKSIEQQLKYGVRYFELRPTIWPSNPKCGETVYLGHVQEFNGDYYGGLGESISEVIQGVKNFYTAKEHENEVAILKFRSFDNIDHHGFGDQRLNDFKDLIQRELGPLMYKAQPTDGLRFNLGNITPKQVRDTGAKVVCVFKQLNTVKNDTIVVDRCQTDQGFFLYADFELGKEKPFPHADLLVADNYANEPFWKQVAKDQLKKYAAFDRQGCALFLLSWTISQSIFDAIATGAHLPFTSIKHGAEKGNPYLWFTVWDQMMKGTITKKKTMNILFADFVGNNLMNDCAVAVNMFLSR